MLSIPKRLWLTYNSCPCLTCTVKIAQVGISEVVYSQGYNMDQDVRTLLPPFPTGPLTRFKSAAILEAAGIRLRRFSPVSSFSARSTNLRGVANHNSATEWTHIS